MKNSTFSAQVANNLLKVLQGYTKGIRFIALLTMLCTIGVGQMWAETATLSISSGVTANKTLTDDGGNSWSVTSDGSYTSNAKYIQVGTNSKKVTYLKLSTSAFSTKSISKIQVWATSKANTKVTTKVYVGGNLLGTSSAYTSQTAASGGTEFSVTNPNNYTGDILIEISRPSAAKGAIYFNKAIVTYTEAGTPAASELTNAQFAWSAATAEATMPSTFEDQPTLTNTLGLDVSYSSSTPAVATINATSGAIDLVGAGTTTISATFAGGKIGGTTYAAKTVSYTLTVKPAPLVIEPIDGGIIDILTHDCLAATSSNYTDFSDKQAKNDNHSDAVYAGRSSRNGNSTQYSIQLNTIDKGRIATTTTGGLAKRVYVRWATQATLNTNNRSLYIYGSNDAFTGSETSTSATKIGTITFTTGATEAYVDLTGDYKYILMTGSGAIYMDEIQITWIADQSTLTAPTFTPAAGTYNAVQNVTISAEEGTTIYYTLDGENPTTESEVYSSAIEIGETTTVKAIAVKNEKVSPVATATYTINFPLTTMDQIFAKATAVGSTATSVEITFDNWVVSAVKEDGKTAFVTDGTKGFVIFDKDVNLGFSVGNILSETATCKVQLYNGFAELTELKSNTAGLTVSTGGTITTRELDAAGIAALTGVNTGSLIKINGTCTSESSKYYVADVQIYTSLYNFGTLEVGAEYNITGIYQQYHSTKEMLPRSAEDIEEVVGLPTATITIADITMEVGETKTIEATITPDAAKTTVQYAITSGNEYITLDGTTITAVAAGTATITATIAEKVGEYYGATKTFSITVKPQDIAVLPFTFNGGKEDIKNTLGMSQTGLDDDYNSAPKLKFNGAGDNVIIHFDSQAGEFSFLLKQNGQNAGTFTVYESANGEDYTSVWSGGDFGNAQSETIKPTLSESARYVKFEYTTKGNSTNYALGSISIAKPDNRQEVTITYYGFTGGYTTNCGGSDLNVITQRVNSEHTIPNCGNITDPTDLGRTFLNLWKDQNGKEHKPGDSFIVTENITLYAQWKLETTGDIELPADKEDLATTDIVVTGGKTLTIPEGKTITINSLTLKGGLLGEDSKSGYAMPSVVIPDGAKLVRKNTTINFDIVVNADSWYPFAVPFAVKDNGNIDYLDPVLKAASTYNEHFAIKTYDGENRAKVGTDQKNNWDKVPQAAGLQPGKGYIISALTYPNKDTATIRITMTVDNAWLANGELTTVNEVTRNAVAVAAHTGAAATEHQRHAGWNFVANPYLSNFAGTNANGSFINGEILINKGDYSYGGEDVPYVTIPTYNFAHYHQVKLSEATLSPAYSFFVQVGKSGTMTFETAGRQQAPASIAARNAEERPVKMDVDITLSDNHSSDQTGIIISDRYNDTYEIGHDLEKLFGSAYNLSVYTLMADNTPLAFQALAIRSNMQVIPVGYRAPEQGEYTFRLNEATSSIDLLNEQYEQLVLVDYQTGELTNLLISDYTFYSERTQADNRFAIYAVPRQNAPTDLPNAIGQDKQAQKIIHNGHLYILRDGNVYNGNGQIVK